MDIHDLEEKGKRKQQSYNDKAAKREQKKNSPALKQLRIAFSTSSLLSWLRLSYLMKYFLGIFYLTSVFLSIPYFRYFISGKPVRFGGVRTGVSVLYPPRDGYAMFYPFVVFSIIALIWYLLYILNKRKISALCEAEEAWVKKQLVPIENYPGVIGEKDDDEFEIKIMFAGKRPEEKFMENVANGLSGFYSFTRYDSDRIDRITLKYKDSGKRSGYKFRKTFRAFMNEVIGPLNEEFTISKIIVER